MNGPPDLFGPLKVSEVSLAQKIEELEREIKVRRRVYPRWVQSGRIDTATAHGRITVLQAILRDYRAQARTHDRE